MEKTFGELKERLEDLEKNYGYLDIIAMIGIKDDEVFENDEVLIRRVEEEVENKNLLNVEIIYYASAIRYLAENDPSLNESLEIVNEYGYEIKNLNSELLASLLATRKNEDEFINFLEDIKEKEFFK